MMFVVERCADSEVFPVMDDSEVLPVLNEAVEAPVGTNAVWDVPEHAVTASRAPMARAALMREVMGLGLLVVCDSVRAGVTSSVHGS